MSIYACVSRVGLHVMHSHKPLGGNSVICNGGNAYALLILLSYFKKKIMIIIKILVIPIFVFWSNGSKKLHDPFFNCASGSQSYDALQKGKGVLGK